MMEQIKTLLRPMMAIRPSSERGGIGPHYYTVLKLRSATKHRRSNLAKHSPTASLYQYTFFFFFFFGNHNPKMKRKKKNQR